MSINIFKLIILCKKIHSVNALVSLPAHGKQTESLGNSLDPVVSPLKHVIHKIFKNAVPIHRKYIMYPLHRPTVWSSIWNMSLLIGFICLYDKWNW
jgi:hypothetical protein